jgi:hypothetical protein
MYFYLFGMFEDLFLHKAPPPLGSVVLYASMHPTLYDRPDQAQDNVFNIIEYTAAIGCFVLPSLMGMVSYYFAFFMLSGFPFASSIQREQVNKVIVDTYLVWN